MKTIEEIRQSHRNNIVFHAGIRIYGRHPSSEQIKKIEHLLDIGLTITEIFSAMRLSDGKKANPESATQSSVTVDLVDYSATSNETSCMRTPLEKHFYKYVR